MLLLSSALRQIALAVDDRALDLRFDAERIHQHAAVDGRLHAVHADLLLLVGRDLGAVGDDAVDGIVHRQPARAALRRRRVPAGHARRALQYFEMARFALEKTHAKLEWIAPGCPVQRRRGALEVAGRSWQEDGTLSARYWSEAAKEKKDPSG